MANFVNTAGEVSGNLAATLNFMSFFFFCLIHDSIHGTGSRILLKETSLMPHIHGLPSIITMLFTPVMELR